MLGFGGTLSRPVAHKHKDPVIAAIVPGHLAENEALRCKNRAHRFRLIISDFKGDDAVRHEMGRSTPGDGPLGVEPVRPAIQRRHGVEVPDLRFQRLDDLGCDIGRI